MPGENGVQQGSISWRQRLGNSWGSFGSVLGAGWEQIACGLANLRRRLLAKRRADYAVIVLDHEISERTPDVPWWYAYIPSVKLPLSLEYIQHALEQIALDPDIKGVLFLFKGPSLSMSQAQSLAQLFARFHSWDRQYGQNKNRPRKQVIAYMESINPAAYVAACAADQIIVPPLTNWDVMGLRVAPLYLQETLQRIGIEIEVVKIAPWKTAMDRFSRNSMSEAEREQYSWLLDSLLEDITQAIQQGRGLALAQVQALVDRAPLVAEEALAAGLIDAIGYEDELACRLGSQEKPARLRPYAQIRGLLLRRPRAHHRQAIGVLSLQGSIIVGKSRNLPVNLPLVGSKFIGSHTVEQQVRAVRQQRDLAAVIVHVDSGGGSALASDLMWRELALLAAEKPLVFYFGNVAASGGYYIATAGSKIVAQPATITGSIGVVTAKVVTAGATARLGAQREVVQRGVNADLYAEDSRWDEAQRAKVEGQIQHVYRAFQARVAEGRQLPVARLEELSGGRVWTGRQAAARGLVDRLGDFQAAIDCACELAQLPKDGSVAVRHLPAPRSRLLAAPVGAAQLLAGYASINRRWSAALAGDWERLLGDDRIWLLADGLPEIR
jgi:protease IV